MRLTAILTVVVVLATGFYVLMQSLTSNRSVAYRITVANRSHEPRHRFEVYYGERLVSMLGDIPPGGTSGEGPYFEPTPRIVTVAWKSNRDVTCEVPIPSAVDDGNRPNDWNLWLIAEEDNSVTVRICDDHNPATSIYESLNQYLEDNR